MFLFHHLATPIKREVISPNPTIAVDPIPTANSNTTQTNIKSPVLVTKTTSRPGLQIPLHAGSDILVYKSDLIGIYSPVPSIYTARLTELVIGKSILELWPDCVSINVHPPKNIVSLTSNTQSISVLFLANHTNRCNFLFVLQSTLCSCLSVAQIRSPLRMLLGLLSITLHSSRRRRRR